MGSRWNASPGIHSGGAAGLPTDDLVVLEAETSVEKAAQEAAEPSDEQLTQILKTADELSEKRILALRLRCCVGWP